MNYLYKTVLLTSAIAMMSVPALAETSGSHAKTGIGVGATAAGVDANANVGVSGSSSGDTSGNNGNTPDPAGSQSTTTSPSATSTNENSIYNRNKTPHKIGSVHGANQNSNTTGTSDMNSGRTNDSTRVSSRSAASIGVNLNADSIKEVQEGLKDQGYNVPLDGKWGPQTSMAVRNFQIKNSLTASGSLDTETLSRLGVEATNNSESNLSR